MKMNINVEAGIALGKTTLIKNLEKIVSSKIQGELEVITEPVKEWRDVAGQDLLKLFAANPKEFAFQTQVHILSTMSRQREIQSTTNSIRIFERSLDASEFIFKPVLYEDGLITELESKILSELYLSLVSRMPRVDGIIYLKGSPELAHERIKIRNFKCDEELSISYLEKLQKKHDEFIAEKKAGGVDVLTIDASKDKVIVAAEAAEFVMKKFRSRNVFCG